MISKRLKFLSYRVLSCVQNLKICELFTIQALTRFLFLEKISELGASPLRIFRKSCQNLAHEILPIDPVPYYFRFIFINLCLTINSIIHGGVIHFYVAELIRKSQVNNPRIEDHL